MNTPLAVRVTWFLLRVVSGLLFFQTGSVKFLGWFGGMPGGGGAAPFASQIGVGGALEFFGGLAILFGLLTRPVAFVLSGEMAVAYWQFHAPHGAWPVTNHGDAAVLYCFLFLFMSAYGAGPWSLDAWIRSRRSRALQRGPTK